MGVLNIFDKVGKFDLLSELYIHTEDEQVGYYFVNQMRNLTTKFNSKLHIFA